MKSDIELVHAVRGGERAAFSELVVRHQRSLLRLAMRVTREQSQAEDVVQESFIKAFEKLHMFEGRASFKSWLFQIALNTARNRLRGRVFDPLSADDQQGGSDPGAEVELMRSDLRTQVRLEVDRLPERQRLALTLRIYEDLSFKEIAEIMGCPYDTAKANYRHAVLRLRERVESLMEPNDFSLFEQVLPIELKRVNAEVEQ